MIMKNNADLLQEMSYQEIADINGGILFLMEYLIIDFEVGLVSGLLGLD